MAYSQQFGQHDAMLEEYDDPAVDMVEGWRLGGKYYRSDGTRRVRGSGDFVVTRPRGYVPYQSVVQPDGRYAYDPNQDQYP
jgi:hypothetical protein